MKLNLLPTHVSKAGAAKTATILSILMAVIAIGASVFLIMQSTNTKQDAEKLVQDWTPAAEKAVATSKMADDIMAQSQVLIRNIDLAQAMMKHNSTYVDLYRECLGYVPSWFRVTSISAAPVTDKQCTVTMTGVLKSQQQYADIMLALLRIPGAQTVSRAGYVINDQFVPNLVTEDQVGYPIRPGQGRQPSDPVDRLYFLMASGSTTTGFTGVGGFGTPDASPKGAMPDWSQVTLTVVLNDRNIQTPNPRATLAAQGAASAPAPAPSGTGGGGTTSANPDAGPTNPGPAKGGGAAGINPDRRPGAKTALDDE
ncbi:MAG: hypothetical protein HONBIEJF_01134 [Fimbriimonadaceae bacterium]|nr:hypothetical protein [Fimbriimonadaceae bacterium]